MSGHNVIADFFTMAERRNSTTCIRYKHAGEWRMLTWFEVAELVRQYARGLIAAGVAEGTPVALFASTRMEWTILDLAILAAGGVTVPIYTNLPADHIAFIVKDSAADIAVVENDDLLRRLHKACEGGKEPHTIVEIEGGGQYEKTMTLRALLEKGTSTPLPVLEERIERIALTCPASYVYTSGTTGVQKGVVLTHGNIYAVASGVLKAFDFKTTDTCMICLPLAHVLGRMTQFYTLLKGCTSGYAESLEKLAENYREVKPDFVVGVPRMLEKMYERVEAAMSARSWHARKIYAWAKRVAIDAAERRQHKEPLKGLTAVRHALARRLVYNKLRARLGGRLYCFVSGGAPLSKDIAKFFTGAGITVIEGYGLTETFAAMTANRFDDIHFGTVGKPIDGVNIKLAADGEILVSGPTVFKEYLHRPDATQEAFEDGWFKTGDIGEFSKEGFLRITDRKKDLIIVGGRSEAKYKELSRFAPVLDLSVSDQHQMADIYRNIRTLGAV